MIDFQNGTLVKLKQIDPKGLAKDLSVLLIEGEGVIAAFQGLRDKVVFTEKRVISVNVQGLTGKKVDYTSLPYSKIQAFSVETAGRLDLDSEMELWFSGLGKVRFEFKGKVDIRSLAQLLARHTL
ncbi:PH domain-containing protein [Salininema proteolyticum]|uniref:PH domain-containing protein n=1 Tax=Salininema proteolyticum TaxID=1607685 RepID=A0ABV8U2Z5_9ACTN